MFAVVAEISRAFSSLPCSANEEVCRSWKEHSQAATPSWPMDIFHTMAVMLSLWMGFDQGQEFFQLFSCLGVQTLSCQGVRTFFSI